MTDAIIKIGRSTVQHGPFNDRVYLMKLTRKDFPAILDRLDELAEREDYSKIFAKVPEWARDEFQRRGFQEEAAVPGLFAGGRRGLFFGKYRDPLRRKEGEKEKVREILLTARGKAEEELIAELPAGFALRPAEARDAPAMAEVYRQVFATYPFPIHDPAYLRSTMAENVRYFGVWQGDDLAALSSSEIDADGGNVEMTDFATLPDYRAQGLANALLGHMEEEMRQEGVETAYTIARAYSFGMNITFARSGYLFGGTLVNNTNIFGRLESMNVWYKSL
ncbi:MAG: putative beta-lysine N-acetyltransferase [Desulfuromonadales bacterium]|nr:putative beta-lysine N-acetyltransferase [Desulfuromonadales bacterium]